MDLNCKCKNCINININAASIGYSNVRLRPDSKLANTSISIYFINIKAIVNKHIEQNHLSLSNVKEWDLEDFNNMVKFLNPVLTKSEEKHPYMPKLTAYNKELFHEQSFIERLLRKKPIKKADDYHIIFGDGRHRSYLLDFLDAEYVPFEISKESALVLEKNLGRNNIHKYIQPSSKMKLLFHGSNKKFKKFNSQYFNEGEGVSQFKAWYFTDCLKGAFYHTESPLNCRKNGGGLVYVCLVPENLIINDMEGVLTDGHYHSATYGINLIDSSEIKIIEALDTSTLYKETNGDVKHYKITNTKAALKNGCMSYLREIITKKNSPHCRG